MSDDRNETQKIGPMALEQIAEAAIAQQRYEDAYEIYTGLASNDRGSSAYVAKAYYARGLLLLSQDARNEARVDLDNALFLDPSLDAARTALESISTTRLRKL